MGLEDKLYADINKLVEGYLTEKMRRRERINVPDINRAIGRAIVDVVMEQDSDKHGDLIAAAVNSIGGYDRSTDGAALVGRHICQRAQSDPRPCE